MVKSQVRPQFRKSVLKQVLLGLGTSQNARLRGWYRVITIERIGVRRFLVAMALHPARSLANSWTAVVRFGPSVTDRHGISVGRQFVECWASATLCGVPPEAYYRYRWFLWQRLRNAHAFVWSPAANRLLRHLAKQSSSEETAILSNKDSFHHWATSEGLPVPRVLMAWQNGRIKSQGVELPVADLFSKPSDSSGGKGAAVWIWNEASSAYSDERGERVTADQLVDRLAQQSIEGRTRKNSSASQSEPTTIILQHRLKNHTLIADLAGSALCTVRIVTARTMPEGDVFILAAVFRMPRGNSIVDNLSSGGIVSAVEIDSGMLGPAVSGLPEHCTDVFHSHPDWSSQIAGRRLPFWDEAKELACRAHGALHNIAFVGWDVALTSEGPILVESNVGWCSDLLQIPTGNPLGKTMFPRAYLGWLAAVESRTC